MLVLGQVEARDMAVASTGGHHRDLALERDERFQDRGLRADLAP